MNTNDNSTRAFVLRIKNLVRENKFVEAAQAVSVSPQMNGQKREFLRQVLDVVRMLKDGGQRDLLLKELAEACFAVRDLETASSAVCLMSETATVESLCNEIKEVISRRLTDGNEI